MRNKFSRLLGAFILGIAGFLALNAGTLRATTVPDPVENEIYVGFRATSGTGSSVSYLLKLGLVTNFPAVSGTSFTLSLGGVGLDLVSTYGSNWFTRSDLYWGIFGKALNGGNPVLYGSRARFSPDTQANPWPQLTLTARQDTEGNINSVLNGIGGYRNSTATANSAYGTLQANADSASSYNYQVTGANDFGTTSQWTDIEGNFGNGAAATILDLFRITSSTSGYRGTFTISNSGDISYSYVVVPEPASFALFGAASLVLITRRRRHIATK